jgi:hypothetical protein
MFKTKVAHEHVWSDYEDMPATPEKHVTRFSNSYDGRIEEWSVNNVMQSRRCKLCLFKQITVVVPTVRH